jgi:sugar lactone lactonase YvrE
VSGQGATVISDIACELGEGPTYDPSTGTMFWFDIVGKKLLEKAMPDGDVVVHHLPVMASALAVVDGKRHLLVTERGLELRDAQTGKLTLHKEVEADNPLTRSNDSRVHPSGALWFGTMAKQKKDRPGEGAIYWYKAGEVRKLYPRIEIPNSICFSPDGAIAYFTDTARNVLMRVACDPATGLPSGDPQVFYDHSGQEGGLDGSVCDADGVVWNARWGSACVDAYAPDGRRIRTVPVPALHSSCPVFIGKRAQHIGVTTAWAELDPAARKADAKAGWTFLLDVEVNGRFDPPIDL